MKKIMFSIVLVSVFFIFYTSVFAAKYLYTIKDDGWSFDVYDMDGGAQWVDVTRPDGSKSSFILDDTGNPNPDDPSGKTSVKLTPKQMKEIIRRNYRGKLEKVAGSNTPLDQRQSSQGKGLDPIWNPGEARPGIGDSTSTTEKKDGAWVQSQAKKGRKKDNKKDDNQDEKEKSQPGTHEGGAPKIGQKGSLVQNEVNPNPVGYMVVIQMGVRTFSSQGIVQFQALHQKDANLVTEFQTRADTGQSWSNYDMGSRLSVNKGAGMTNYSASALPAGQWRVRARANVAGAEWSNWTEFTVQGTAGAAVAQSQVGGVKTTVSPAMQGGIKKDPAIKK
jgi:hypothetical protein